jgi:outer membrane cobalamin receptor
LNPLRAVVVSVINMGNPYLKPGETQSVDIGYRYATTPVTLSSTVYVRRLNNQIVAYSYAPTPGDTALVSSYENAGSGTVAGLEVSLMLRASAKWDISLSSDLSHVQQSAPVAGIEITGATFTHLTKLGVTLTPDPRDSLQMQGQLRGRSLLAAGTQSSYGSLNLSYSHTFTPKLKLVVNANDVLDTVRYRERVDTAQYREHSDLRVPGQVFYVGLTYELGAAGVGK